MKKWLVVLVFLVILAIGGFYIYYSTSGFQQTLRIGVNAAAFKRTFPEETTWHQWWPGKVTKNTDGGYDYAFNGNTYRIADKRINGIIISIHGKNNADSTVLDFLSLHPDSIILHWKVKQNASLSPLDRIRQKNSDNNLKKDLLHLQESIRSFYAEDSNIYGIRIIKEQVRDSLLVSTFAITPNYPDPGFIYALIDNLKNYILSQNAEEKGYPMLHITTKDSLEFTTRVAIPVNKKLPGSGAISYKWMLGGGNILVTEVKGGPFSIRQAFRQLEYYVVDHNRTAPAIPFESLVTDRRMQKDTAQWITRIYYPVM